MFENLARLERAVDNLQGTAGEVRTLVQFLREHQGGDPDADARTGAVADRIEQTEAGLRALLGTPPPVVGGSGTGSQAQSPTAPVANNETVTIAKGGATVGGDQGVKAEDTGPGHSFLVPEGGGEVKT